MIFAKIHTDMSPLQYRYNMNKILPSAFRLPDSQPVCTEDSPIFAFSVPSDSPFPSFFPPYAIPSRQAVRQQGVCP